MEEINRGDTGRDAYEILRKRVDELIDEVYPQFKEDEISTYIDFDDDA